MKPSVNIPERLPSSSSGSILGNSSLLLLGDEGPAAVSASAPSSMDSSEDHRQLELVVGTGGQDAGTPAVVMLGRSLAEAGRGRSHSMDISLLREAEFGPLPAASSPPNPSHPVIPGAARNPPPTVPSDPIPPGILVEQALEALLDLEIMLLEPSPASSASPEVTLAIASKPPHEQLQTLRRSLTGLQAFVLTAESQGGAPMIVLASAAAGGGSACSNGGASSSSSSGGGGGSGGATSKNSRSGGAANGIPVNRTREQLARAIRRQARANTEEQTALAAWLSGWVGNSGAAGSNGSPAPSPTSDSGSQSGAGGRLVAGSGTLISSLPSFPGNLPKPGKGHKHSRNRAKSGYRPSSSSASSAGGSIACSSAEGSCDFGSHSALEAGSVAAEAGSIRLRAVAPHPIALEELEGGLSLGGVSVAPVDPPVSAAVMASPSCSTTASSTGGAVETPLSAQQPLAATSAAMASGGMLEKVSIATTGATADQPSEQQQSHGDKQQQQQQELTLEQASAALRLSEGLLGRPQVQLALVAADSWEFDVFEFAGLAEGAPLTLLVHHAFSRLALYQAAGLSPARVCSFVRAVEEAYLANPYHNRLHAADVVQNLFCFLTAADPAEFIRGSSLDVGEFASGYHPTLLAASTMELLQCGDEDEQQSRSPPLRTRSHRAMTVDSNSRPLFRGASSPAAPGYFHHHSHSHHNHHHPQHPTSTGSASGNSPRLTTRHGQPFGVPQSPISERRMHEMIEDHNLAQMRKQLQLQAAQQQPQTQHSRQQIPSSQPGQQTAAASPCKPQTLAACVTPLELAAAFLAAAAHDVAHPGTTNQFLINTDSELALLYNDRSVLEHFHLATAFRLLRQPGRDLLADLAPAQRTEFRATVIEMVLATDMKQHVDILDEARGVIRRKKQQREAQQQEMEAQQKESSATPAVDSTPAGIGSAISSLPQQPQPFFDGAQRTERLQLLKLALHCADVANPTKPLRLYLNWADRIMTEWFTQGDRERQLGLPVSPMMDRNKPLVEVGQLGFIDYCVAPLFETWIEIAPATSPVMDYLRANRQYWANLKQSKEQLKRSMMAGVSAAAARKPSKAGDNAKTTVAAAAEV